jgi:hypothetical protein
MSGPTLLIIVHSDSFEKAKDIEAANVLFECSEFDEILMLATPANNNQDWLSPYPRMFQIAYEDRGDRSFVARYKAHNSEVGTLFHDYVPKEMLIDLYGCKENSAEFAEIKSAFNDLLAFEAISRSKTDAIFATESPYLLEKNVWIQKRFEVKILSFLQALEYTDLYLRRQNSTSYYSAPHHTVVGGNAFHYWFLLKDLVPKFAEAWGISVFGADRVHNGLKIQNILQGFASKFESALYSSDRISMEYMKRPNNSTEWEMLYNLNYFCMLVTGIFDLLGWLSVYRYSIPIQHPYQVSLHITDPRSKGAKFVAAISRNNPSLASFIVTKQNFIHSFYPMRDATQHREPVSGARFEQANEGWTVSTANVKQDAVSAIEAMDKNGYPFTEFGLLNTGVPNLMEPNRFARRTLRELIDFSNTYLEMTDFPSLITEHPDLVDRIAHMEPIENYIPFVAKVYWKRDCHLPILFRNR